MHKIIYDKIQRSEAQGSSGTPYISIVDLRPNTDKDKATEVLKNFTTCAHAQGAKQEDDMGGDHLIRAIHFRLAWWYKNL